MGSNAWKDGCLNNCRAREREKNVKTMQKHSCTQVKKSRNKFRKVCSKFRLSFTLLLLEKAVAALQEKKWYILWFSRKDLDGP